MPAIVTQTEIVVERFTRGGLDALTVGDLLPDTDRQSASDRVAHRIREMIHVGELSAGDWLPSERELSERLGLARLTLRGGLQILRDEGYISARRGRGGGTVVMDLSVPFERWLEQVRAAPELFADATELRIAAETHAVRLAIARLGTIDLGPLEAANRRLEGALSLRDFRSSDAAFHQAIGEASGSPRLAATIRTARGEMFVAANVLLASSEVVAASRRDHREILRLITIGDAAQAADTVERHIRTTMTHLFETLNG